MADETTSTATSDQTATATTDAAATDATAAATADTASATDATTTAATDDLGTTALGGGEDDKAAATDGADKTGDQTATATVPEKYELTAPEGFEINADTLAAATPVFKELGLSNEQAGKLMPVAADFAKRLVEQRDQQFLGTILEQRKAWLSEAKADKDIGGANWDGTMQSAAKAFDALGFPKGSPLRVALDESGFGNHPELIRFAAKVGKAIGEDDFVRGDANAPVKAKTAEETFWPGQGPKA